jgi:hypothetical protein
MQRYELATLTVAVGATPKCAAPIAEFCNAGGGTFLGSFATDVGALNRILVLRGFADEAALRAERARMLASTSPFGCSEWLTGMELDSYTPLDWLPPVRPGAHGPVYEVRTYQTRPHGLPGVIAAWREALPARLELSPLVVAMHTLDGAPRFTHVWPYAGAGERAAIRGQAVARGGWPPKGGPDFLTTDMRSWLCMPLPGSPLS